MAAVSRLGEFEAAARLAAAEGSGDAQQSAFERGGDLESPGTDKPPVVDSSRDDTACDEDRKLDMPRFFAQAKDLAEAVAGIKKLRKELEAAHKEALSAATAEESDAASRRVAVTTAKVNERINGTRTTLREMETRTRELERDPDVPRGSGHMRMRQSKHRQLAQKFLKAARKVQDMQATYRAKYRATLERQYRIVHPEATDEEVAGVARAAEGTGDPARMQIFAQAVREDAKATLVQMQDRLGDVRAIEQSIKDLAQLFLDLQDMIVTQGDVINSIEANVDATLEYTEAAATEMKASAALQRSLLVKKWIFVACVVLLVVVVLLIVAFIYKLFMFKTAMAMMPFAMGMRH